MKRHSRKLGCPFFALQKRDRPCFFDEHYTIVIGLLQIKLHFSQEFCKKLKLHSKTLLGQLPIFSFLFFWVAFCFAKNRLSGVPLSLHSFATLRNDFAAPTILATRKSKLHFFSVNQNSKSKKLFYYTPYNVILQHFFNYNVVYNYSKSSLIV